MSTFCFHRSLTATAFSSDRKIAADQRGAGDCRLPSSARRGSARGIDSHLAQGNYLCAAEPTIADLLCYGDVAFAEICAFDLNRWPNVAKWAQRVMLLPGFKAPFELLGMEDAELS